MADEQSPARQRREPTIMEVLPKAGLVYSEKSSLTELHCKPKIMPIKSAALERLELMETEAKAILNSAVPPSRAGAAGAAPQSRAGRPTSARPISAAGRLRSAAGGR
jgi:hypothetical protein